MASLRDYIRAAFSAKPIGMFVPPNWLGLAAFGVLGLINPGFWLLGMGLELGYLYWLGFNPRFRRFVDATSMGANRQAWRAKLSALVTQLGPDDQRLYRGLENRCSSILSGQQTEAASAGLQAQSQGLLLSVAVTAQEGIIHRQHPERAAFVDQHRRGVLLE